VHLLAVTTARPRTASLQRRSRPCTSRNNARAAGLLGWGVRDTSAILRCGIGPAIRMLARSVSTATGAGMMAIPSPARTKEMSRSSWVTESVMYRTKPACSQNRSTTFCNPPDSP
jgi:hypothetical protein